MPIAMRVTLVFVGSPGMSTPVSNKKFRHHFKREEVKREEVKRQQAAIVGRVDSVLIVLGIAQPLEGNIKMFSQQ